MADIIRELDFSDVGVPASGVQTGVQVMSEDHAGFIIHVKNPTRDPHRYVACLSITPKTRDGITDVASKVERNIGAAKAIQLAADFIARCGASEDLIAQVQALAPGTSGEAEDE